MYLFITQKVDEETSFPKQHWMTVFGKNRVLIFWNSFQRTDHVLWKVNINRKLKIV